MVGCTQGMLLCLDREQRMAYVLGEVLQYTSEDAATLCGVTPAAFRKRLQRARARLQTFMRGHCGLLDPANACRCHRRVGAAIAHGRVDPSQPLFATRVEGLKRDMHAFTDAGAVFRSHPELRDDSRSSTPSYARSLERPEVQWLSYQPNPGGCRRPHKILPTLRERQQEGVAPP